MPPSQKLVLDSNSKIAEYIYAILQKDGLLIPSKNARSHIIAEDWLKGIMSGVMTVSVGALDEDLPTPRVLEGLHSGPAEGRLNNSSDH